MTDSNSIRTATSGARQALGIFSRPKPCTHGVLGQTFKPEVDGSVAAIREDTTYSVLAKVHPYNSAPQLPLPPKSPTTEVKGQ